MRLRLVLRVVGQVIRAFSLAFVAPIVLAFFEGDVESGVQFLIAGLGTLGVGIVLSRGQIPDTRFQRAEALAVVALTWLLVASCGAVPYLLYGLAWQDALFESMSGFTTTGATILSDFSAYDRPFFLWRAMTQWFGGLGVIALFIVVLPRLGIAGRQLFFAEASAAPTEAVSPQVRKSAQRLWLLYSAYTILLAVLLVVFADLSWFAAFAHSLTTLSAGGFSPNGESIAGYHNPIAEWILCPFMLLSGASFNLQYKVLSGRFSAIFRDGEFVLYCGSMALIALALTGVVQGATWLDEFRATAFQSASLMSSTGFASTDYNLWSDEARALLVLAMCIGGCAGSAAGGPKVVRLLLVLKHILRELRRTLHPRAVLVLKYKGRPVADDVMRSVFTLVALYVLGYFFVGVLMVLLEGDLVLGFSAALACMGNVGPAFGVAGPMGSFASFSDLSKMVLVASMWVGRLEIVTVAALLHHIIIRPRHRGVG